MKIVHASIPADEPQEAARVLAEIMGGEALPFPPGGPDSWMAWAGDGSIELEIVRRGAVLQYDEEQGNWHPGVGVGRGSECHLAIAVDRPAPEIVAIAERAGWPARICDRGDGFFQLVEIWVDGCFMLELMDPAQTAHYERVIGPGAWKQLLQQMEAA